jgi:hypothetical protein
MTQPTQADQNAANKAFDIAFRGDTEGIDEAMAALFAVHAARERAGMIAWLRFGLDDWNDYVAPADIADAFERGEDKETDRGK